MPGRIFASVLPVVLAMLTSARPTSAQPMDSQFQVGAQLVPVRSSEFSSWDIGAGGRFSWYPRGPVGIDAEINWFPSNLTDGTPFSRSRTEGLFGVTVGPRLGRVRLFGKARPGFLAFAEAPQPIACILIFPPPLPCTLGAGRTLFALDLGGGIEVATGGHTVLRVDVGDRLIRYPGPASDRGGTRHDGAFLSHDFRVGVGGGVKF